MKKLITYFVGIFVSVLVFTYCQTDNNYLIKNTDTKGTLDLKQTAEVEKTQNVIFQPKLLLRQQTVRMQLFDETFNVYLDKTTPTTDKNIIHGKIKEAKGENYIIIASSGKVYACNILKDGILYQLRWIGNDVYQLRKIDQEKFPKECISDVPKDVKMKGLENDPCANTDPADFIDIMVAYTDDARSSAGNKDAIEAEIYLAVYETNLSYLNSNVTQRIRLVHLVEVNYAETGNVTLDRNRLQAPGDGFLDNLHTLRDAHSADIVVLITEACDYCGMAYIMDPVTTGFENYAFAVVKRSCATGYYSFAHEMGHIMSARHDCANDPTLTAYPYGHGFEHCGSDGNPSWRTVMCYNNCGSTRLPYFSNPGISYLGDPMGTNTGTCQSDNHRVLNNTALIVANFRCHSANVPNVWMKDTWNDTGLEPDPATAGEDMWQSPYIWVRNTQDVGFLHQHQHQNPEFGQHNWVYVKLHNGGPVANGNLQIYIANASLSLTWPAAWTLLATIPVTIISSTSRIVEYDWASPPGIGHYCMVARWVSPSDPMTFPETADINYNTRQNNNIIWRNLNIVDLVADDGADVALDFIAIRGSSIKITFDTKYPNKAFVPLGKIVVSFEKTIIEKFPNGLKGSGFKMLDRNKYQLISEKGATFEGLFTDKEYKGKMYLHIQKTKNTPASKYWIHITQQTKSKIIGGVSYQINTDYN